MEKMLKTKQDIQSWLDSYEIKNYQLIQNKAYGFVVNVNKDVVLYNKQLKFIPIKFNKIYGDFLFNNNLLSSLSFCPQFVEGNFDCSGNKLKTLQNCPKIVNENFWCFSNQLISLKGSPRHIGGNFDCCDNLLISLKGCPIEVGGSFACSDNHLQSLDFCPNQIGDNSFFCGNNPLLGAAQYLENFQDIYLLHKEIVDIKNEKNKLSAFIQPVNKNSKIHKI